MRIAICESLSDLAGVNIELEDYNLAEEYLKRALDIAKKISKKKPIFIVCSNLTVLFLKKGSPKS